MVCYSNTPRPPPPNRFIDWWKDLSIYLSIDRGTERNGTVPYYSTAFKNLKFGQRKPQKTRTAADKVKIIEEIDGAEHRAMLADERLHKILVDYLTGKTGMDE